MSWAQRVKWVLCIEIDDAYGELSLRDNLLSASGMSLSVTR
jgi:hypothetical protein